ncbi:MAG: AI-2E family transporter [Syntrophales bacterium]|nr:AI-2E family transporter [Syntrophales bacterium]
MNLCEKEEYLKEELPRTTLGCDIAAWLLFGAALLAALKLHLLPALIIGFLVYELVHIIVPLLEKKLSTDKAHVTAVAILAIVVVGAISALIVGLIAFIRSDAGSISALMQKMAEIIDNSRSSLPAWIIDKLPANPEDIKAISVDWLRHHAAALQLAGKEAGHLIIQVIVGMVAGAMVSLHEACPFHEYKPLAGSFVVRLIHFGDAFRGVVFAQVRISALNTVFTTVYLVVVLPLCGVHLPLTKTMIAFTFVAGMLPVIGNLISNSVIVIISLSSSFSIVISSLVFLVLIHKLEYFLNARIVGSQIKSAAWEILIAMLVMESAFGLAGVVAAPIYYAFVKNELLAKELV